MQVGPRCLEASDGVWKCDLGESRSFDAAHFTISVSVRSPQSTLLHAYCCDQTRQLFSAVVRVSTTVQP